MNLAIWYSPGTDEQIEVACRAAQAELERRGIRATDAQQASFDVSDFGDEHLPPEATPAADAVVAWFAAEDAAFRSIHAQTGEWPHQAALIHTQDEDP